MGFTFHLPLLLLILVQLLQFNAYPTNEYKRYYINLPMKHPSLVGAELSKEQISPLGSLPVENPSLQRHVIIVKTICDEHGATVPTDGFRMKNYSEYKLHDEKPNNHIYLVDTSESHKRHPAQKIFINAHPTQGSIEVPINDFLTKIEAHAATVTTPEFILPPSIQEPMESKRESKKVVDIPAELPVERPDEKVIDDLPVYKPQEKPEIDTDFIDMPESFIPEPTALTDAPVIQPIADVKIPEKVLCLCEKTDELGGSKHNVYVKLTNEQIEDNKLVRAEPQQENLSQEILPRSYYHRHKQSSAGGSYRYRFKRNVLNGSFSPKTKPLSL